MEIENVADFGHCSLAIAPVSLDYTSGLTNLVQVYTTGPIFTDDATLTEARRRLFSSRCRLAHLLACRARFACLFHLLSPDSSSHSSSLQHRLSEAGFSTDSPSNFCRQVHVTAPPTPPSVLLEWPPVSSEVINLENIPASDLEVINPLLASDMSRFSWMAHADSLFGASGSIGGASSSLADELEMEEEEEMEESKPVVVDAVEFPKPPSAVPNGSALRTESGTKKSPVKSTIERFPVRSAGIAPRRNPAAPSSTATSKSTSTFAASKNATATKPHTSAKIRSPPKSTTHPTRPPPLATATKASIARQPVASATRQLDRKSPSSKTTKAAPKAATSSLKPKSSLISSSKSPHKPPSTATVSAFSPALNRTYAFMDDDDADADDDVE
ncbi:unnamed protein product, partial [Hydatigera taeniaeformis]|uniref:Ski_Sno domain-containing protein n=1 Tax=Hydatigena taeniaeformis TaxID=6205 RepID=A0A0R3WVZ7_HYDTA